jgi:predicted HicB family RNase H-like nuclease
MPKPHYGFRLSFSDEDNAWVATCLEIDGVSGLGSTQSRALTEANDALELVLEEYAVQGVTPPPPRGALDYSGKFVLRIPKSVHERLADRAHEEGVSINALASTYLAMGLGIPQK